MRQDGMKCIVLKSKFGEEGESLINIKMIQGDSDVAAEPLPQRVQVGV